MKILLLFILQLSFVLGYSQGITLNHCLESASVNFPLNKQFQLINENTLLKLQTLNTQFYPKLDLTGQVSWQNDVPHVSIAGSPFKVPYAENDQYKTYIDLKQTIYDGGTTKAAKEVEQLKSNTELNKVKADIYSIRSGVISSFYLILALDEQLKQVDFTANNLTSKLAEVNSMVNNGVVIASNADIIQVEILKIQQTRIGLEEARMASIKILAEYTAIAFTDTATFTLDTAVVNINQISRPELMVFESQRLQLSASENLLSKNRNPKVSGYGQLGYGNPGYNVLLNSFEPFYMVGLRLNWTVYDWKATRNEKSILNRQAQMVTNQEEAFLKNIHIASQEIHSRINKMQRLLETDSQIIELRKRITASSASQLKNGVITSSDYIDDLMQQSIAQLSHQLHVVELSRAKSELTNLLGSAIK